MTPFDSFRAIITGTLLQIGLNLSHCMKEVGDPGDQCDYAQLEMEELDDDDFADELIYGPEKSILQFWKFGASGEREKPKE